MKRIRNLEIHVTHRCNLTCESCSHYSNQGHKGSLSLEDADAWMTRWHSRINPSIFSLLGGEPSIHPRLTDFVVLSRTHWPEAHLRLVTNGFFLHRHPHLPAVLQNDPNACLYLSVHHDSPEYQERLRPIRALLNGWVRRHGIQVTEYSSHQNWTRRYRGFGSTMEPFADAQPRQSWDNCPGKYCAQLLDGDIWKCAPLAYLPMQHEKFRLSERWAPYLRYRPLEAGCSEQELQAFFDREEESSCGMCSAKPERIDLPIPLLSLTTSRASARAA